MKKTFSLFLACLILVGLMAACGSDEPAPAPSRDNIPPQDNAVPEAPADRPAETRVYNLDLLDDQILWINGTHAVLTVSNGHDVNLFGGTAPTAQVRADWVATLDAWWGIDSKEELLSVIDDLTAGLHNPRYLEEVLEYGLHEADEEELINELQSYEDEETAFYLMLMFYAYDDFGQNAIMGWDLSRATQLCAQGYLAGYFDFEEALLKAFSIGKVIQQTFDSWEDFWESYFFGYYWWSQDMRQLFERMDMYDALTEDPNSPFNLDWMLSLD
jgi:predicted small lipoprotein YifL